MQRKNAEMSSPRQSYNQQAWSEGRHQPPSDHYSEPNTVPGLNLDSSHNNGSNYDQTNRQQPTYNHQTSEDDQPRLVPTIYFWCGSFPFIALLWTTAN